MWKQARELTTSAMYPGAISPDGQMLAGVLRNKIRIWNLECDQEIASFKIEEDPICQLAWSVDGKTLGALGYVTQRESSDERDYCLVCWDVRTHKRLSIRKTDAYHFALSFDGQYVAEGFRSPLRVREVRTGREIPGSWMIENLIIGRQPEENDAYRDHFQFLPDGTLLNRNEWRGYRRYDVDSGRCCALVLPMNPATSIIFW